MRQSFCPPIVLFATAFGLLLAAATASAVPPPSAPASAASASSPSSSAASTVETLWIIPHTHWEGAVFKTREEYLEMGLPNILRALELLAKYPNYKFVLDQVAYVKPFLERYPEQEPAFRKFVAQGRLQLVLGMDVMPDVNTPGGESFVRQIQYGKGYYRKKLGVDVTVAWLVDTFGFHAQMPQLLTLGGYKSFWFSRGVPKPDFPSEFIWAGIDGTRMPAYWLPYSYGLFYFSPKDPAQFKAFARQRFDMLAPQSGGRDRVAGAGIDVSEPEPHLPVMVEQYAKRHDGPPALRFGVPTDFEAVIDKRPAARTTFRGELNPIFQGVYSSRTELKQWMRSSQERLTSAEKLSCIAALVGSTASTTAASNAGASTDSDLLWRAWEPVLFSETHDCASGVMTDPVYQDTIRSYEFSKRLAQQIIDEKTDAIAARINTQGDGTAGRIPIVVFNTLGWMRTDAVEAPVGFIEDGVTDVGLRDSANQDVPVQIVDSARYSEGGLKQAKIAFIADRIPALGYAVYWARAIKGSPPTAATHPADSIENQFYRVRFNPSTGEIKSLLVKADKSGPRGPHGEWEAIAAGGNVLDRQTDHGDLWELYHGLGMGNIASTATEAVPASPASKLSNAWTGAGTIRAGPVFSEFIVSHPFDTGTFATRVRLYSGVPRIDIQTQLVNNEKFVRYQALFPTTIKKGTNIHSIPFGAVERPVGVEFPAQDWVDYSDGKHGVALLNIGNPGNVVTDGTMMLSLMRSETLGHYGFGGGYEPGMSAESGLELGRPITMQYALAPHNGDWREASVYRQGLEFNNSLIVKKTTVHRGVLAPSWGMLDVSAPNVVVSSLNPGGGNATIVRVYEAAGIATSGVRIHFNGTLESAEEVNLMEDPIGALAVVVPNGWASIRRDDLAVPNGDFFQFDLKPFEIKTFSVRFKTMPH